MRCQRFELTENITKQQTNNEEEENLQQEVESVLPEAEPRRGEMFHIIGEIFMTFKMVIVNLM